jgi:hypothetical protein
VAADPAVLATSTTDDVHRRVRGASVRRDSMDASPRAPRMMPIIVGGMPDCSPMTGRYAVSISIDASTEVPTKMYRKIPGVRRTFTFSGWSFG